MPGDSRRSAAVFCHVLSLRSLGRRGDGTGWLSGPVAAAGVSFLRSMELSVATVTVFEAGTLLGPDTLLFTPVLGSPRQAGPLCPAPSASASVKPCPGGPLPHHTRLHWLLLSTLGQSVRSSFFGERVPLFLLVLQGPAKSPRIAFDMWHFPCSV